LLIHLIYGLGIRRGEALGIKIGDHIDWPRNRILIARNADDPDDPRTRQPLAKTLDRFLPVKDKLLDMLRAYVTNIRSKIPAARRHTLLFVSHQTGRPLSAGALNKVFRSLRERVPDLPADLTPHVLRHAWNDAFSRLIDANNIDPAREAQMRSAMMGWVPTSGMAAVYNRRKIREDADKLSLAHQKELLSRNEQ
jgi:integrase